MNGAYCSNEQCEYNENGGCECEDTITIDEDGMCQSMEYKFYISTREDKADANK